MKGDTARQALVEGPGSDIYPAVSPDGRWLAYTSDESGRWEIYLRPFPDAGTAKRQVSTTGGFESRWSHDGRELFYMDNSGRLVAVPVGPGPVPILGAPKPLFPIEPYLRNGGLLSYDVAPDGKRFLMARPLGINRPNSDELIVVENFFQVLKTKVKR
jgi:serine/threonine-protein kinase